MYTPNLHRVVVRGKVGHAVLLGVGETGVLFSALIKQMKKVIILFDKLNI